MAVEINKQSNGAIPLCELPEGCIANVLSLTSPRDACRLSLVDSTFRSAARSDDVWERFLPADYRDILSLSTEGVKLLRSPLSKKELYLHLCDNPILIDGGTKSFSLDKSTGKKCYMLSARDLTIVWSDTPTYWRWIPLPESRFSSVAELRRVCWLEIRGAIKTSMLSPDIAYAAYLVFKMKSGFYGFEVTPEKASVGFGGQEGHKQFVHLLPDGDEKLGPRDPCLAEHQVVRHAKQRRDGWMEVKLGEIFVRGGEDVDLEMSLMEVKAGNWKSGLAVEGIEIRPKKRKNQPSFVFEPFSTLIRGSTSSRTGKKRKYIFWEK